MTVETLTYAALAERLKVSPKAARHSRSGCGCPARARTTAKTLVTVDLSEIAHRPMPARSPSGHHAVTGAVAHSCMRPDGFEPVEHRW